MCGVFGFVSYDGKGPALTTLQKIATATMVRGPHAFGFAWLDSRGRMHAFKQHGRIVDHLGLLAMAADARFLIGHCRYATHGDPANNLNNHPHPADGGWIVHNGVIRDYDRIIERNDFRPVSKCDSEVLGLLIEEGEGKLVDRCREAVVESLSGPLVMLGLWARPGRLVAMRSDNPLHVGRIRGGERYYLGSLRAELPGKVWSVKNGSGLEFTPQGLNKVAADLPTREESGGLFGH
jgi:glucosamine 6-phosphate synthetase-like amidotransferase/phosphosugar isomerase protein